MTEVEGCMFTIIQFPQHDTYVQLQRACALVRIAAVCTINFEIISFESTMAKYRSKTKSTGQFSGSSA